MITRSVRAWGAFVGSHGLRRRSVLGRFVEQQTVSLSHSQTSRNVLNCCANVPPCATRMPGHYAAGWPAPGYPLPTTRAIVCSSSGAMNLPSFNSITSQPVLFEYYHSTHYFVKGNQKTALQSRLKTLWTRLDLNQRLPPCHGGVLPLNYGPKIKFSPFAGVLKSLKKIN